MITVKVSTIALLDQSVDCLVVMLEKNFTFSKELQQLADEFFPSLQQLMQKRHFTGAVSQVLTVPVALENGHTMHFVFVGFGGTAQTSAMALENYRRAIGSMILSITALKCSSLALRLPSPKLFGVTYEQLAAETVTIANMASYHFDDFITDSERVSVAELELTIVTDSRYKKGVQQGVDTGKAISQAVNCARYWVDLPPSKLTPPDLADKAKIIAKKQNLKVTVFNEKQVNEMGMGGLGGVSKGSDRDCQFVILEYTAQKKTASTIGFVGKGITFDSGGLSLKPPKSMETMKEDMSGAAAVISAMQAIATLKPKVNVVAIMPLAENLPSGKALKPGDIVTFYNGKTAEVKNTDAEGRLVLADALAYAVRHYKLDAIIDIATLTGACAYALGPFFTGLMSQHDELVENINQSAERSGDRVWRLPLHNDYKAAIRSDVADMCNIGSPKYMAGSVTAAFFLKNFVQDVPWAHLDIAGTAYNVPDMSYYRPGATGIGVRLLIDLAMNWK